jgi:putative methyltransferase (TIGR04325 family)
MKTQLKNILKQVYWQLTQANYKRRFATDGYGLSLGVFATIAEAIASAPKTKTIGYNSAELAQEYAEMLETGNWENSGRVIAEYDYPVLMWLNLIFQELGENISIFDLGGNVGVHFYAYQNYLKYPVNLRWQVCDFPEIVKAGAAIAEKRSVQALSFTSNWEAIHNSDIFFASGSIHYIDGFADKLSETCKPKHLLINRLPLYNGKQFVTLQNGGKVFYPSYFFNKSQFISDLEALGYKLVDIWEDRIDAWVIPSHPHKTSPFCYGVYFKLT